MASAKSGVHVMHLKSTGNVNECFQKGERFYKLVDPDCYSGGSGSYVILRIPSKGHILHWASATDISVRPFTYCTTDFIDFSNVLDVRYGQYAKLPRDADVARSTLGGTFVFPASSVDMCYLTIITGPNLVDLTFYTFVASSPDVAEFWGNEISRIGQNILSVNAYSMYHLERAYYKIKSFVSSPDVKVKDATKLFANSRDEKRQVEKAMIDAKFTTGKEETLDISNLTEDKQTERRGLGSSPYSPTSSSTSAMATTSSSATGSRSSILGGPKKDSSSSSVLGINKKLSMSLNKNSNNNRSSKSRMSNNNNNNSHSNGSGNSASASSLSSSEPTITVQQFCHFLNETQRDPRLNEILYPYYTDATTLKLIQDYEPDEGMRRKELLTITGFLRYLLGEDNGVLSEETYDLRVEDMVEPLSHYFINSSHNTYLIGPQYNSRSSVEMYRQVLLAGCRSIELDCWDRGDEPVITHGPSKLTRVTEVPFKDVITAVRESAFKTSSYPIVLSFENHCNPKNQQKMAQYCKKILGDLLLTDPLPNFPLEPGIPLPSPENLKYKILIKNKKNSKSTPNPSRDASIRIRTNRPPQSGALAAGTPDGGIVVGNILSLQQQQIPAATESLSLSTTTVQPSSSSSQPNNNSPSSISTSSLLPSPPSTTIQTLSISTSTTNPSPLSTSLRPKNATTTTTTTTQSSSSSATTLSSTNQPQPPSSSTSSTSIAAATTHSSSCSEAFMTPPSTSSTTSTPQQQQQQFSPSSSLFPSSRTTPLIVQSATASATASTPKNNSLSVSSTVTTTTNSASKTSTTTDIITGKKDIIMAAENNSSAEEQNQDENSVQPTVSGITTGNNDGYSKTTATVDVGSQPMMTTPTFISGQRRESATQSVSDKNPQETSETLDSEEDEEETQIALQNNAVDPNYRPERVPNIVEAELSELVNYVRAMGRFKSFEESESRDMSSQLFSLVENKAQNFLREKPQQMVNHNKRQITRIFPNAARYNSSNYLAQAYFNAGCQMVALNFQTLDLAMQLNMGMFEMNGRSGYILKPECMRRRDRQFDPFETETVENIVANTLTIQVISGQLISTLTDRKTGSFVEVEMYGLSIDTKRKRYKTKIVAGNGINPVYADRDSKPFEFHKIVLPDLATLRIVVNDENGKMLAMRILPVVGLRPGLRMKLDGVDVIYSYRHVVLRNAANQPTMASLFVKIVVRDYVPEAHKDFADALVDPIRYVTAQQRNTEMLKPLIDEEEIASTKQPNGGSSLASALNKADFTINPAPSEVVGTSDSSSSSLARNDSFPASRKHQSIKIKSNLNTTEPLGVKSNLGVGGASVAVSAPSLKLNESSSLGGGGSRKTSLLSNLQASSTLDQFHYDPPSVESLSSEKKMLRLLAKQDKEMKALTAKQLKEREKMREKHRKKELELESKGIGAHPKSSSSLFGRATKKMHKDGSRSNRSLDKEEGGSQSTFNEESTGGGGNRTHADQLKELRNELDRMASASASRQWKELKTIKAEHLLQMKNTKLKMLDMNQKSASNKLETWYKKDVDNLMNVSGDKRKNEVAEFAKSGGPSVGKDAIAEKKREIEQKSINMTLEQRKAMHAAKTSKMDDINLAVDKLRDSINKVYQTELERLNEDFDDKIQKGTPLETTRL